MTTATPTRTLGDVFRERLEAGDPSDRLMTALNDIISTMAPYADATQDLRPSEVQWIDELSSTAADRAHAAAVTAIVDTFAAVLPRLLPSVDDPTVPPHLWEQGGDELQEDVAVVNVAPAAAGSGRTRSPRRTSCRRGR